MRRALADRVSDVRRRQMAVVLFDHARVDMAEIASDHHQSAEGEIAGNDGRTSPAVRIFKADTPMLYAYQIFNARLDRAKKPQLEVQTRLFREGQQVFATDPAPLPAAGAQDPKRLIATGRLGVSKAPPGHYALQVIVTDRLAKERYQLAAQSMAAVS